MSDGKIKSRLDIANERASGKVVDIFTKKSAGELAAEVFSSPDSEGVERYGKYLGTIPKQYTARMRDLHTLIMSKQATIDNLVSEYEGLAAAYNELCSKALMVMNVGAKELDAAGNSFFISENGDIWTVPPQHLDEFSKFIEARERGKLP